MTPLKPPQILALVVVIGAGAFAFQYFRVNQEKSNELDAARVEIERMLEGEEDPEEALQSIKDLLRAQPDDPTLHVLEGLAYHRLRRFTKAIEALTRANEFLSQGDERDASDFYLGRALVRRYLESGDRADLKLAESIFATLDSPTYAKGVSCLLGLAHARRGAAQDVAAAKRLLTEGLAGGNPEGLDDPAAARKLLAELQGGA